MANKSERRLSKLIAKRENLFRRTQITYDAAKLLEQDLSNQTNLKNFEIRVITMPQTITEYNNIVDEIIDIEQELSPDYVPNYASLEVFQELCNHINYISNKIKGNQTSTSAVESRVKLPKVELMKFNGEDLSLWPLFYENFKNLIHFKEFSNAEKLQYLLGSLCGKSLKCVSSIEPLPENYEIIWKLLEETYQDRKYLAALYLDKLLSFRPASSIQSHTLQTFLEQFDTNVTALKRLKLENLTDFIFTHIAMSKLPQEFVNTFELVENDDEIPTYDKFLKFIKHQSKVLPRNDKQKAVSNINHRFSKTFVTQSQPNNHCVACKKSFHLLVDCKYFKDLNPDQRFQIVKDNNLCINCFSSKHKLLSCTSRFSCTICKLKHHTLLHRNTLKDKTNNDLQNSASSSKDVQILCSTISKSIKPTIVLLSTAQVNVVDRWNKMQTIRVLIDSGSMSNLLTIDCCKALGLPYEKISSNISGVGGNCQLVKGKCNIVISSRVDRSAKYGFEVLLVDKITNQLPEVPVKLNSLDYLQNLQLADPTFHIPGNIQGILGANVFASIIRSHHVKDSSTTALDTSLGYIVMGKASTSEAFIDSFSKSSHTFLTVNPLVTIPRAIHLTTPTRKEEDPICESFFIQTVKRNPDTGRYAVALPFSDDPAKLGNSYTYAQNRLFSLEKRLHRNPDLKVVYANILRDYIDQGHMSLILEDDSTMPSYYIPHHCIFKQSSSTPCRIVFDASMKTENGFSLNDILYTGPKLQNDLLRILLMFRLFPVAVTADIRQMYRQINLIEEHRRFQRILWRFDETSSVSIYELNTVTFGVKSSPYLSLRTIKQLVDDEGALYPEAVSLVTKTLYIDDLICSLPDVDNAVTAHFSLVNLFNSGGFQMVKWMSNSSEFLSQIPNHYKLIENLDFARDDLCVLGLFWNPRTDTFSFKIDMKMVDPTKRNMLSIVARIFDPLNFLAPVTLFVKLLIKRCWALKLDWDDPAPKTIRELWYIFQKELHLLNTIKIPRHLNVFSDTLITLIGFSDASPVAYGCVIYCKVVLPQQIPKVFLLIAKSKVSPSPELTLPKLELSAAALLAKQLRFLKDTYGDRIHKIYAFSDSTITLGWINSQPQKCKPFISNRISQIHQNISPDCWFFVPGKENAADCVSRSLTPSQLVKNETWFSGPQWLGLDFYQWPVKAVSDLNSPSITDENRVLIATEQEESSLYNLINRFSSWSKLLNSTVYVLRFLKILPNHSSISNDDLCVAETYLIRAVQQKHFAELYLSLEKSTILSNSKLRKLHPFMHNKVIRVGGRLSNANIKFDQKHPILLPKSDPFVSLLVDYYHKKYCHAGAHLLQSLLYQNYWILSARSMIRQRVWKCNTCFKINPKPIYPFMADLPSERVNCAKAFLATGVDYTGAFSITMSRHRGVKSQKAYICLFICLSTKAIHLELASDLSSDAFISAFKRFISRRGNCATLFSDCGTNFVGAKTKFDEIYQLTQSRGFQDAFQRELNSFKITWKFNPPSSPWMGGFWESNIKSVKTHLSRVIGNQILTYEEFYTVLTQIEAVLNSRPLCLLSTDPSDPVALTPAHFLYGSPVASLPVEHFNDKSPKGLLNRYKLLDSLVQHYWKRWRQEYLFTLQSRQKWNTITNPPSEGMIVIIIHDNLPPLNWPLAVIERLYPGKDGTARVALVKTRTGSYVRPVAKLCPLPNQ